MNRKIKGSLLLSAATLIWGSAFVAQSTGMAHVGPFTFQAVRCTLAVLGLLAIIYIVDRKKQDGKTFLTRFLNKQLWLAGICCGIPLFFAVNLQQVGLVTTDPGKSGFLTAMYIVFVPLFAIFIGKLPTLNAWIGVLLGVVGLYFLSCVGVSSIQPGDLLTLGCAAAFAIQILFVDKFAPSLDPLRLNCLQALVCAIGSTIAMFLTEEPTIAGIQSGFWEMGYVGLMSMGAAYSFQIIGQKDLEPTLASLIMSMESVVAVLCGWIILKQHLSKWELLGCILIFSGILISQLNVKKRAV